MDKYNLDKIKLIKEFIAVNKRVPRLNEYYNNVKIIHICSNEKYIII